MPEHLSIFIVKHPSNASREVAFDEAMRIDGAIKALDLEVVGGHYAHEGDAIARAVRLVMADD